ncbi:MAG: UDP-N-acetylmuramate dehydrogenase [Candidatus Sungbacteria bacterium]|nr:UDP-N-acetylmuramate dehydrogenase [Candidatus Sungbacteria bacterium]
MIKIKENISLALYTVYKIGGHARFFADVKKSEDIIEAIVFAKEKHLPFVIIGAGSNMLVADKGFFGVAIHVGGGEVRTEGEKLFTDAGVMTARAVVASAKAGLSGFEWGIGVPGSIGGSIRGNAGCFGGAMKDVVENVEIFDSLSAERRMLEAARCEFSYRHSVFKKHPEWIILSAVLSLKKGDQKQIQQRIREITEARAAKQDIGTKSCGCIFKNITWAQKGIQKTELIERFPWLADFRDSENIPASLLIDRAELKGKRVGRVYVSPKHANYFVNEGEATAEEVVMLISLVKDTVRRKFGISLEEEIQYVGF